MNIKKSPWSWVPSLYFAEGLPYVAVMAISVLMYKQMGLSNAGITFYTSWLYLPWTLKPLWSPFVDLVKTKRWWIVTMQLLIGAAFGGVAFTLPTDFWLQGSLFFFWVMAFTSATHDIAADGFYMLDLSPHDQAFYVGIRTTFYRLATIFGQGVLVMIAGNLQLIYRDNLSFSWSLMFYGVTGLFIGLWLWHSYVLPRPKEDVAHTDNSAQQILTELWHTIKTFFGKKQVVVGILFMLFYRMPEGLLAKVAALFLVDKAGNGGLGLSPQEYGLVQGTVGIIGLTLGGILGGLCVSKDGLKRWLWPMVMAITLPDLVYVYMSYMMPNFITINVCVFVEQFGYGFGFTAYMMYLIYYSRGKFKTSHYALCTTFMSLSMMLPGFFAGALQEMVGYRAFFIIVVVSCVMTYIVTALLKIAPKFGMKGYEEGLDD